jgi:hypothetical protein
VATRLLHIGALLVPYSTQFEDFGGIDLFGSPLGDGGRLFRVWRGERWAAGLSCRDAGDL